MNADQIRIGLKQKGLNYGMVAEALDCSTKHVSTVARRITTSRRVAKAIALALGKPVTAVFPDKPEYAIADINLSRTKKVEALRKELTESFLAACN